MSFPFTFLESIQITVISRIDRADNSSEFDVEFCGSRLHKFWLQNATSLGLDQLKNQIVSEVIAQVGNALEQVQ